MAVLTDSDRELARKEFVEAMDAAGETTGLTKADLRAAFQALDAWFDTNAATLNQALPLAARQGLTTVQKARLLKLVITRRYIAGA